jgi:two-component system, LytTR family, sensor histidine kinase AlgZ
MGHAPYYPGAMPKSPPIPPTEFEPTHSRPQSLWPESTRAPAAAGLSTQQASAFDTDAASRAEARARSLAAFDVCHPALALRAVLLVQAVLALVALALAAEGAPWLQRQAMLTFAGAGGTLAWLVAVCACNRLTSRWGAVPRAVLALLLGATAAWMMLALLAWAGQVVPVAEPAWQIAAAGLGGASLAGLLWSWLALRARIWQPANASARLAELQSRIRPHFLFNTLNTAVALVRVDPARAEAVLEDLAELFRAALAEAGTAVTLDDEVALARRYLEIEAVRFGKRLQVQWFIDTQAGRARVPPLVLQPLVENAVRHGIEPTPAGGLVRVRTRRLRGQVVVTVSNTLGTDPDQPANPGHGMALANIRERLRLLHDVAAQCDVWREPGQGADAGGDWFHARIVLPAP